MIPAKFDYLAPTSVEEALSAPSPSRRRRQDDRRWAVPAAGAPDAAQRTRPARRHRRDRLAAGRPRRRRRARDRRDDARLRDPRQRPRSSSTRCCCTRRSPRSPTRRSGTAAPSAAHCARRPGRRLGAPILALDAEFVIAGQGGERTVAAATSSSTSSRPRSVRTRSSPRSGSRSTTAGARTTRSSCGSPTSGRSWPWPRRSRLDGGTISEARIGLVNMGSTALRAAATEEALVGSRPPRTAYARRATRPARAPTRPRTSTVTPTTVGTSRPC